MPRVCPKINACHKIKMVLDKDLPFTELYRQAADSVCQKCGNDHKS